MDTGLTGRGVIVTGATSNIGRAIALAFADEGAKVAIVGRDERAGAAVGAAARERGATDVLWVRADLTDSADVDAMVAHVDDRFGRIDVLVNNVGGNTDLGAFAESDSQTWEDDVEINLMTNLRCTRAVLPHMIEAGYGRIVNIGSTSGIVGDPYMAVYSAAKGAVHAFTKVLAKEVGQHGVTVNAVAPYATRPESSEHTSTGSRYHPEHGSLTKIMTEQADLLKPLYRKIAVGASAARPPQIAAAAVYLCSEIAGFVTGEVHSVSGGVLL